MARLLLVRCKGLFLGGTGSATWYGMPFPAQTECLARAKGFGASSEVESSGSKSKETTALMARKNLLSLFDEFARFGGDVAVVQTRGYVGKS